MKKILKLLSAVSLSAIIISGCSAQANDNHNDVNDILNATYNVQTVAENGAVTIAKNVYHHGETALLTAKADEGYKFYAWEVEGINVGTSTLLSYEIKKDTTFVAVFLNSEVTYKFVEEDNITFVPAAFGLEPTDVIGREPEEVYGKLVNGWSNPIFVEDGLAIVNADYDFDASADKTIVINDTKTTVHYGDEVTAVAQHPDFTHWVDENENIISYDSVYNFKAFSNQTLVERAGVIPANPVPSITMGDCGYTTNTVTCAFTISGPTFVGGTTSEDYGIVDAGMEVSSVSGFTGPTTRKLNAATILKSGQFRIIFNLSGVASVDLFVRGFITYYDAISNPTTITTAYNKLYTAPKWDVDLIITTWNPNSAQYIGIGWSNAINATTGTNVAKVIVNGTTTILTQQWVNATSVQHYGCPVNTSSGTYQYELIITISGIRYGYSTYVLNGSRATLDQFKATKITELDSYASNIDQNNYDVANWNLLLGHIENGKSAINSATSFDAVLTALQTAINNIDSVELDYTYYRNEAKSQLAAYADAKGESKYTPEAWDEILGHVSTGSNLIDVTSSFTGIDELVATYKGKIDSVASNSPVGTVRAEACGRLEDLLASKVEADYYPFDWNNIVNTINTAKSNINNADDEATIIGLENSATSTVNAIEKKLTWTTTVTSTNTNWEGGGTVVYLANANLVAASDIKGVVLNTSTLEKYGSITVSDYGGHDFIRIKPAADTGRSNWIGWTGITIHLTWTKNSVRYGMVITK